MLNNVVERGKRAHVQSGLSGDEIIRRTLSTHPLRTIPTTPNVGRPVDFSSFFILSLLAPKSPNTMVAVDIFLSPNAKIFVCIAKGKYKRGSIEKLPLCQEWIRMR